MQITGELFVLLEGTDKNPPRLVESLEISEIGIISARCDRKSFDRIEAKGK